MKLISCPSLNFDERAGGQSPSMIILHYTGTLTSEEARVRFCDPAPVDSVGRISPHYMIDGQGQVFKFVEEGKRAWHAGRASWGACTDINSASIGIEIWNTGHEFRLEDFIPDQIDALIALIKDIRSRWDIPDKHILGHSDVAPGRKLDPGEKFPWKVLAEAGVGVMPSSLDSAFPRKRESIGRLDSRFRGNAVKVEFFDSLRAYGYTYTDDLPTLLTEFRRHFLPHLLGVDGVTDEDVSALFDISR